MVCEDVLHGPQGAIWKSTGRRRLHVIAGTACEDLAELVLGNRHAVPEMLWLDAPEPVGGYLTLGDAPGFGVRLNESLLA